MKILVVRFSSIGDIVLTTPVIRWLANQKKAEIHFLCFNKYKSILANNPYIKAVHGIDKSIDEITSSLKLEQFDLMVDLHKNVRTLALRLKLGIKAISFDKNNFAKWQMVNLKTKTDQSDHLVLRYLSALAPLGIKDDGLGLDYFFNENELNATKPLFKYEVLVLGATYFTKRIPLDLCKKIISKSKTNIVMIGGADVKHEAEILANEFPKITINYVAKLSIDNSAYYLKHAEHVHTADTGMMHIAAAFQVPITIFWGNTIPAFGMYPYYGSKSKRSYTSKEVELSCRPCSKIGFDKCPKGHFDCMNKQEIN